MQTALPRPAAALLGLLAVLLAAGCASEPADPLEELGLTEIYDQMGRRSVVRLGDDGATWKGVALGDGSWVLSAHVARGAAEEVVARDVDGRRGVARRVSGDAGSGLALYRLEGLRARPAALAIEALPASGDDVYLMADDELSGMGTMSGPLSGRREAAGGDLLRLWGRVLPTEVGGPVFAASGLVVGIVIADELVDRDVRASYAQAVPELLEFLERAGGPTR